MRIDSLKTLFYSRREAAQVCSGLLDEYCSFQDDSALYYCKMQCEIAPWTDNPPTIALARMKMARQAEMHTSMTANSSKKQYATSDCPFW